MSVYGSSVRPTGPYRVAPPSVLAPPSKKRKISDDNDTYPEARPNLSTTHPSSPSPSLLGFPRPPHHHVRHTLPLPADRQSLGKPRPWQQAHTLSSPALPPPAVVKLGGRRLLMAGYLAHEFLSHGTLFGCPYSAATTQATSTTSSKEEMEQKMKQRYEEVSRMVWVGDVHVPGVVNPTQLGGWLHKQQEK